MNSELGFPETAYLGQAVAEPTEARKKRVDEMTRDELDQSLLEQQHPRNAELLSKLVDSGVRVSTILETAEDFLRDNFISREIFQQIHESLAQRELSKVQELMQLKQEDLLTAEEVFKVVKELYLTHQLISADQFRELAKPLLSSSGMSGFMENRS